MSWVAMSGIDRLNGLPRLKTGPFLASEQVQLARLNAPRMHPTVQDVRSTPTVTRHRCSVIE